MCLIMEDDDDGVVLVSPSNFTMVEDEIYGWVSSAREFWIPQNPKSLFHHMVEQSKESDLGMQLRAIQTLFSTTFPLDCSDNDTTTALDEANSSQSSVCIDLSCCLQDTKVTIPTLNGWLLDYPVVYLFGTDHIEEAIYNLSTKSLRIFKVLVQRNSTTGDSHLEELTSFSVLYDLSMGGSKEVWAETFMERMCSR